MKKLIAISFFVFSISIVSGQNLISKTLIDKETNQPVMFAHVYIKNDVQTGTISNTDGKFVLKNAADNDTFVISHLSYNIYYFTKASVCSDTIILIPKVENIKEVTVKALSARSLLENVIDSIPQNYYVDPLIYNAFIRISEYDQDSSDLHILGEYIFDVYQNKDYKFKYHLIKLRVKPFSKSGHKACKDYRLIPAVAGIYSANIIGDREDVFNKKKLKLFDIEYSGEYSNKMPTLIVLKCIPKKPKYYSTIILYIDKATFAVKKFRVNFTDNKGYRELVFKQLKKKWYLAYQKQRKISDLYLELKFSNHEISTSTDIIFNIDKSASYNKDKYKSFINIVAEPIRYYNGNWNDDFWENYNFIPLPDWIKQIIEKKAK